MATKVFFATVKPTVVHVEEGTDLASTEVAAVTTAIAAVNTELDAMVAGVIADANTADANNDATTEINLIGTEVDAIQAAEIVAVTAALALVGASSAAADIKVLVDDSAITSRDQLVRALEAVVNHVKGTNLGFAE